MDVSFENQNHFTQKDIHLLETIIMHSVPCCSLGMQWHSYVFTWTKSSDLYLEEFWMAIKS